ncbi:MAG: transcription-repair coupling factor, partial [Deltaproteobacteria bacterium]|nr:transcription-repair coupling factor [Deltaproteobacteria bacterium]
LGSGFRIAMQDLEIRGAGNLLGKKQSGHISAIGYELYQEMLADAVAARQGQPAARRPEPEVKIKTPAYIPPAYIGDTAVRLQTYKRIAAANDEESLYELLDELLDRFGVLPPEVEELGRQRRLKLLLQAYGIRFFEATDKRICFTFGPEQLPRTEAILALVTGEPERYRLTPDNSLACYPPLPTAAELLDWTRNLLQKIF